MSYDLMVFRPDIAPRTRVEFLKWYYIQVQWSEGHSYSDPAVTSDNLKNWFFEMIESFPALNGPYAKDEADGDDYTTDYCIGKNVIYVTFAWSLAESAYEKMKTLNGARLPSMAQGCTSNGSSVRLDHSLSSVR